MTHSLSDLDSSPRARHLALAFIGVLAVVIPSITTFASLVTTDLFIVSKDDPVEEDVYVTSMSGKIDGVIDGDLVIFTGDLTISGTVTGTVTVFSSGSVVVEPTGTIIGSLRGTAVSVTVRGEVGDDVFVTAPSVVIGESATVGRDAMVFAGTGRIEGIVERDVRGRTMRLVVDGTVGGDLDVATQKLEVGPDAAIEGDVLYRSPVAASIAPSAAITGTTTRLPTQSNFVYGIILALANVIGFFGFLVVGIVVLSLFRGSSSRAAGAIVTRPIRSLLVGLVTVIVLPAGVVVLAVTLVGIPLAVLAVLGGVALFIVGPVPAVTALGNRILLKRGGLFGAFLVGAVVWRLGIWLIPVVGGFLYLIGLVWGSGAWVLGALATRRADPVPVGLLPDSLVVADAIPVDWEPPLAPQARAEADVTDGSAPDGDEGEGAGEDAGEGAGAGEDEDADEDEDEDVSVPGDDPITFRPNESPVTSTQREPVEESPPHDDPDEGPSSSDTWGLPGG